MRYQEIPAIDFLYLQVYVMLYYLLHLSNYLLKYS